MEFEALMHDKKLKLPKVDHKYEPLEVSKEHESAIEKAQIEAQSRIARRYGR